ncbi:hypothetical protein F5Y09DRAFT_317742 [Xylaria sp. FL1042]|nr:hypothetical protein F5Y09DRAFT_317742 [Xylaria sp. FL1042]
MRQPLRKYKSMADLDDIPAGAPPPGVVPNLDDPVSKGPSFVVLGIFTSLSFLSVLVRVFVRFRFTKSWGWDDYTCIVAAIGSLSYAILYSEVNTKNPVKHIWNIGISSYPGDLESQSLSVNGIAYQITIFFTKLSILFIYLRIFGVNRLFARFVVITIAIITVFYIPLVGTGIGFLAACNDLTTLAQSHFCHYNGPIILLNASFNVVTDLWLLLLPYPVLMKLQLQTRHKLGLIAVFAAGVGACAASIARLVEIGLHYHSLDPIWSQSIIAEFSIAEINIGIIVACASCFPVFIGQIRDWVKLSTSSKFTQIQNPDSEVDQIA